MHRSRGCLDCCCSDSLAFATEPVLGSLANLLGAVERLPINCQQELKVRPLPPPPLFTPPPPIGSAEYCDERVCLCLCVCLSVREHIFGTARPNFAIFSCTLPTAVARSSSVGVVIRCVLPVLWMTSCLLISQGCSTSPPS